MEVKFTIEVTSAATPELQTFLNTLSSAFGPTTVVLTPVPTVEVEDGPVEAGIEIESKPVEEKKKRKSPTPKAPVETKAPVEEDDDLTGAPVVKTNGHAPKLTKDDLITATQNAVFKNAANKGKIREFLDQFSAPKVGDLPETEWNTFVTFANELN